MSSHARLRPNRCCTWLEKNVAGQRVLDYGSGSGILGFGALSFGATEVCGTRLQRPKPFFRRATNKCVSHELIACASGRFDPSSKALRRWFVAETFLV